MRCGTVAISSLKQEDLCKSTQQLYPTDPTILWVLMADVFAAIPPCISILRNPPYFVCVDFFFLLHETAALSPPLLN